METAMYRRWLIEGTVFAWAPLLVLPSLAAAATEAALEYAAA